MSNRDLTAESERSAYSGKNSTSNTSESYQNYRFMSGHHKCNRCRRFFNRCRCHRMMYRHYKTGCMCKMVVKGVLFLLVAWLLCKLFATLTKDESPLDRVLRMFN